MIIYKANSEGKESVLLKDGLDFNGDENINASVASNGIIKYSLNKKYKILKRFYQRIHIKKTTRRYIEIKR